MLDADVKAAVWAVADDWRATHEAGGDCIEYPGEIMEILLPEIERSGCDAATAVQLSIFAGNYADGSDPNAFRKLLIES